MAGLSPHFLDRQEVGQAKQGLASQQCLQLYPFLHKVLQLQHIVGVGVGHTAVPLDVCLGLLVGQAQRRALQHRTAHLVPLSRVKGRQHPPAALTGFKTWHAELKAVETQLGCRKLSPSQQTCRACLTIINKLS
ncbi:TPA: hypothetical protein ACH3X1_009426 [Trebouxia sp. C0004]